MTKRSRRLGALTVAETQQLLGADESISVGKVPGTPLGMRMIASLIRDRISSAGGRPTDPSWTIVRKIPMKPETWKTLNRCAVQLEHQNIRVSAGQVAAITLERGLEIIVRESAPKQQEPDREVSEAALVMATRACEAMRNDNWYRRCE